MKVILLEDVKKQGKKDQVIDVSDGYANNYLIKNKLAVPYTKTSSKILKDELDERKANEEKLVAELTEIKKKLDGKTYDFKVSTGKEDRVFGSVSTKQIAEKLASLGYKIDKKCIKSQTGLDTLGVHKVDIELHKKVKFSINVQLVK
jgi:large subunit ribosomal protein L9